MFSTRGGVGSGRRGCSDVSGQIAIPHGLRGRGDCRVSSRRENGAARFAQKSAGPNRDDYSGKPYERERGGNEGPRDVGEARSAIRAAHAQDARRRARARRYAFTRRENSHWLRFGIFWFAELDETDMGNAQRARSLVVRNSFVLGCAKPRRRQ